MQYSPKEIGEAVRSARKALAWTQKDLALAAGTGLRFVIELEQGKVTCQIGKVLAALNALGVELSLNPPVAARAAVEAAPEPAKSGKSSYGTVRDLRMDEGFLD
jgi:y4mF family transcriptional regulator